MLACYQQLVFIGMHCPQVECKGNSVMYAAPFSQLSVASKLAHNLCLISWKQRQEHTCSQQELSAKRHNCSVSPGSHATGILGKT